MSRRFLGLERLRRPRGPAGERPRLEGAERFAKPVSAPTSADERVAQAHLTRFQSAGQEAPLALDPSSGLPFLRCARCGADSARFGDSCNLCGADLHTPDQRAYNAELARARQAEAEQERTDLAKLDQARAEAAQAETRLHADRMLAQWEQEEDAEYEWILRWTALRKTLPLLRYLGWAAFLGFLLRCWF